jgi:hypothetical protein
MIYFSYTHNNQRQNKLMGQMIDLQVVADHFIWQYNYIQDKRVAVWLSLVTNLLVHERY